MCVAASTGRFIRLACGGSPKSLQFCLWQVLIAHLRVEPSSIRFDLQLAPCHEGTLPEYIHGIMPFVQDLAGNYQVYLWLSDSVVVLAAEPNGLADSAASVTLYSSALDILCWDHQADHAGRSTGLGEGRIFDPRGSLAG